MKAVRPRAHFGVVLGLTLAMWCPGTGKAQQGSGADGGAADRAALAAGTLETTVITGKPENLLGEAKAASKGQASAGELQERPFLRRGELLEVVPGMTVTQHSGGGKANQYFLRGFNLDHGTDFGIFVDGMPVNWRTHGHGQGYADINFLIPELVEQLDYFKGPFYAELGDFTTAGAARFHLYRSLPEGMASFSIGENNYYRSLLADSWGVGAGTLTGALEYNYYDGPWVKPDELQRWNGFVRYALGDEWDYTTLTFMGYDARWDATDQLPLRAIQGGMTGRLGFIDPTVGGDSHRYSVSMDHQTTGERATTRTSAYVGTYRMDLFSNFTYFVADLVNGDQFNQFDDRWFAGGQWSQRYDVVELAGLENALTWGLQTHHDWIDGVALRQTRGREIVGTVRQDDVYEMNLSAYGEVETLWTDWMRTQAGIRGDLYYFDVTSGLAANSGEKWDTIASPKLGLVLGPWRETEFYLNGGLGFHSNDARGVTTRIDPSTGDPVNPVDPLVRTYGAETGVRTHVIPNLTTTLAFWYLQSDSELVYVGDAGTNESGDGSERYGVEWAGYWRPRNWIYVDAEVTATDSYFVPSGDKIENSIPVTASGGVTVGRDEGLFGGLRTRYFSPRPLTADGSVESGDAFQVNARLGFRRSGWEFAVEALNLFDANDNDVEYFYESRLPGEAAGVEDIHLHPYEPRQFRFTATRRW